LVRGAALFRPSRPTQIRCSGLVQTGGPVWKLGTCWVLINSRGSSHQAATTHRSILNRRIPRHACIHSAQLLHQLDSAARAQLWAAGQQTRSTPGAWRAIQRSGAAPTPPSPRPRPCCQRARPSRP
jgi:hypothetical protein